MTLKTLAFAGITMISALAITSCGGNSIPENPKEKDVATVEANGVSFELVFVEPGQFRMGATSEQDGFDSFTELPAHDITLSKGYWIGKLEVSQELWEAVMGSNPSAVKEFDGKEDKQLPVSGITWADAKAFVKKLSEVTGQKFRLPTEAECEYAARGASKTFGLQYSGSKYYDRVACFKDNSDGMPHPIGQFMPNELDMRDMNGNVSEWVEDNYAVYKDSAQTDPCVVLADTLSHVARGGNFASGKTQIRTASREYYDPDYKSLSVGLRVVMDM